MAEIIREQTWTYPTTTGEVLNINGCFDTMHRWSGLGFNILRYLTEDGNTVNIGLNDDHAGKIASQAFVPVCERTSFFEREYSLYLSFMTERVEEEFGTEFTEGDVDHRAKE